MAKYVLALDQGTTSSRAILFDHAGSIISVAQQEFPQIYPSPGLVEHDPEAIWSSQLNVAQEAISKAVTELGQYRQVEEERIKRLAAWEIDDTRAESLLLRCYEAKLLSPQTLPTALAQWRRPEYPDFEPRTAWSIRAGGLARACVRLRN